ncbi:TlpA family protein disulfide reductase [Bowmanella pacifica]|uniref:Thioredoxin n=1 Tax=Bowmanella pacifica TaxID=502051 RepID=A0A918DL26_9ALTE|nr:TlpA disulfide reductase family protein [Bowmanella pacifica]GGO73155.1 thioredoxin [Bowmanella pacifica]
MPQKALILTVALIAMLAGTSSYYWFKADFHTLQGDKHHWRDLRGQYVVVNYFAEWCAPCLRELPELNRFNQMIAGDAVKLFGVSFDALSSDALAQLADKYEIDFELILTEPAPGLPLERPQSLPATFIIGPDGKLIKQLMGEQHADDLLALINALQQREAAN